MLCEPELTCYVASDSQIKVVNSPYNAYNKCCIVHNKCCNFKFRRIYRCFRLQLTASLFNLN